MTVNSYFEYYLTMLGWAVSNGIWWVLLETGIILIPIVAIFVTSFTEVRQRDAETNVNSVVKEAETKLWIVYVVIMFACVPTMPLKVGELNLDTGSSCGVSQINHDETRWGAEFETIGNMTPRVPLWWGLVHILSKGVTHTAVATMPCTGDIRGITLEIQNQRIKDPNLLREVGEFARECFAAANAQMSQDRGLTESWMSPSSVYTKHETGWIGSQVFLDEGYYDAIQASTPQRLFPYTEPRDEGYAPGLDGGGYPTCAEWWQHGTNGLRARLAKQIDPTLGERVKGAFSKIFGNTDTTDALVRSLVSPANMGRSGDTSQMFSTQAKSTRGGVGGVTAWARDSIQNFIGNMSHYGPMGSERWKAEAAHQSLRHTLEMFQSLAYMVLVVTLPLVLVFSGFSLTAVIAASMGMFAIHFLTFWWELSRWMDSKLLSGMYMNQGIQAHAGRYIPGTDHSTGYWMAEMVLWASTLLMPALFITFMAWASFRGVSALGAIGQGTGSGVLTGAAAGAAGSKMGSLAGSTAKGAARVGARAATRAAARRMSK